MDDFLESGVFSLPSEMRSDMTARLKDARPIKSLEFQVTGDGLDDTEAFSKLLRSLKQSGVKISHKFSIKLDFPRSVNRRRALEIIEFIPKPFNGTIKVRAGLDGIAGADQPKKS